MSFQQGLSGLNAASKNLEVIGNNVANSNTYGEKTSRAEFADMYAAAMTGASGSTSQSATPSTASTHGGLLNGVTGNASSNGNGGAQASASADSGNSGQLFGSAAQGARSTAAPVREGGKAQADNTRSYVRSSVANASTTSKATRQAAASGGRNTAAAATAAQPSANASGSASGNGSAQGSANGSGANSGSGTQQSK